MQQPDRLVRGFSPHACRAVREVAQDLEEARTRITEGAITASCPLCGAGLYERCKLAAPVHAARIQAWQEARRAA